MIKPEIDFILSLGCFTHGLTINLKKREQKNKVFFREEIAKTSFDWFMRRLNQRLFGKAYKKGFKKIVAIGCYERGHCKRPHLHLAIACPEYICAEKLVLEIRTIHARMEWRIGKIDINSEIDCGWIEYMSKHGFENLFFN
jgi:hypothetical protein